MPDAPAPSHSTPPHGGLLRFAVGVAVVVGALIAVLLVGGALVTVLATTSDEVERSGRSFPATERLRIDTGSGDVTVIGERRADVRVEARVHHNMFHGDGRATVALRDGTLRLDGDCSLWTFLGARECGTSFTVRVPRGTAVAVLGGGSSDVRLDALSGPLDVQLGSGDVDVDAYRGTAVRATTGSGDVELRTLRPPRRLLARTGSGDVEIVVPDVPYSVGVDTGSGDEDVQVTDDPTADRSIEVRTGSGDVSVFGLGG